MNMFYRFTRLLLLLLVSFTAVSSAWPFSSYSYPPRYRYVNSPLQTRYVTRVRNVPSPARYQRAVMRARGQTPPIDLASIEPAQPVDPDEVGEVLPPVEEEEMVTEATDGSTSTNKTRQVDDFFYPKEEPHPINPEYVTPAPRPATTSAPVAVASHASYGQPRNVFSGRGGDWSRPGGSGLLRNIFSPWPERRSIFETGRRARRPITDWFTRTILDPLLES